MSLSEKTKVEVVQGDITDYSSVLEASRGADVIVHMASLVDVWHRIPESRIYSVNINGEADDQHRGGRGKHRFTSAFVRETTDRRKRAPALEDFQGLRSARDLNIYQRDCVTFN